MTAKRLFEFEEGTSSKFWEVWLDGTNVVTRYGRLGSTGQQTVKAVAESGLAHQLLEKLVREKTKKGYLERSTTTKAPTAAKTAKTAAALPTKGPGGLTREDLRGLRVCLRGKFALGAIKDLEGALKALGARPTKFWTDADVIFTGEGGQLQSYYEGYAQARRKQAPEQKLAELVGDLRAVRDERSKKERPVAKKLELDPAEAAFRDAFWKNPDDLNPVKVWADTLVERGDVRGEFMQLCLLEHPTDEQDERRRLMRKKLGGQLVGPARPYVRTFDFDDHGLVNSVTAEAPRVVEGFDLIAALHPRLHLTVTSLRTKTMAVIAELVKHPLGQIHMLWLDANGLSDNACAALAPGLDGLKRLSLFHNDVTQKGLEAMAPHLADLEALALSCSMAQLNAKQGPEVVAGWVKALTAPGLFPSLKMLALGTGYGMPAPTPADRKRLEAKLTLVPSLHDR